MFGIINNTLRIASLSDSAADAAKGRDKHARGPAAATNGKPAKLRFRSNVEAESWAKRL